MRMRFIILILMSFLPTLLFAVNDFEFLNKELKKNYHSDRVVIWGTVCAECNGFSQSKFILMNEIGSNIQTRVVVIDKNFGKSIKSIDSVFIDNKLQDFFSYSKENYLQLKQNFDSTYYILNLIRDTHNPASYTLQPTTGECYFFGIYNEGIFSFVSVRKDDVNLLFKTTNTLWTLISLLINHKFEFDLK